MKAFLKAQWKNLIMMNYRVSEDDLAPYLPYGTELDLWEGKPYVSLVAFLFDEMNVMGLPAIGNRKFEEINLRMYVKRIENGELKRGVTFIKEIVPKHLVSMVANGLFSEHYETLPMNHKISKLSSDSSRLSYGVRKTSEYEVSAQVSNEMIGLEPGGFEEFIAEHYWGYSKVNATKSIEYEVAHPKWDMFEKSEVGTSINFASIYGDSWSFLNRIEPESSFVLKGSEVRVGFPRIIKA